LTTVLLFEDKVAGSNFSTGVQKMDYELHASVFADFADFYTKSA